MSRDPMHTTVCDGCFRGTWYHPDKPGWPQDGRHSCSQRGTLRVISRASLAPRFAPFYWTGQRIRVRFADGEELTGTVGKSTGWVPVYLLMRTSRSIGSPWVLGPDDRIVAVQHGRKYRSVAA